MRKISFIITNHNLKTTSFSFFIADLDLLSCQFDSFTFKLLDCVIFILIKIKIYFVFNKITFDKIVLIKLSQFLVKIQKQFLLPLQE